MHTSTLLLLVPAFLQATTFAAPMPLAMQKRASSSSILAQKHANLFATLKLFGNSDPCTNVGFEVGDNACVQGRPAVCSADGAWDVVRSCGTDNVATQCFPVPKPNNQEGINLECVSQQEFETRLAEDGAPVGVTDFPIIPELVTKFTGLGRNVEEDGVQEDDDVVDEQPIECPAVLVGDDEGALAPPAAAPSIITTSLGADGFNPPAATPSACTPVLEDPEDEDDVLDPEAPLPTEAPENVIAPPPAAAFPDPVTVTIIISDDITSTLLPTPTVTETIIVSETPVLSTDSITSVAPTSTLISDTITSISATTTLENVVIVTDPTGLFPTADASKPTLSATDIGGTTLKFIDISATGTSTTAPIATAPAALQPDIGAPGEITFIPSAPLPTGGAEVVQDGPGGYYY